jgi:two-component system, sensor histidine kinase and response regulator
MSGDAARSPAVPDVPTLGTLALDAGARSRVRRKAFDVVRSVGGGRDLATRVAAEVSDVTRWLEALPEPARLTIALQPRIGGLTLRFAFAWNPDVAPAAARRPAVLASAGERDGAARVVLAYPLPDHVDEHAPQRARAVLAARSREELVAGLQASNEALQRSTAEAREASAAKARFLATMSHEIRTPMNAVLGMNRLALDTDLDPRQRDYLEKIELSAKHLLGIIDDVLDISKLEADKLVLERDALSVTQVLDTVSTLLSTASADKGLALRIDVERGVPALVQGDALRLRQVLVNLVTNAVKFTDEGEVVVRVERLADETDESDDVVLRFAVSDTGIGLSRDERQRLFAAFAQADASITRRYGGTGLGLAICRRLVELMGGEIGVESARGVGSTFWFTARFAPVSEPSQARLASPVEPLPGPARLDPGLRVLVVEDNALNREVAAGLLAGLGITPAFAHDGLQALESLRRERFDVVLMDVQMPVMDGITATRRMRADPALRDVPVIAMTASVLEGDRDTCLAAGMNAVVTKPVDPDDLARALLRWVTAPRSGAGGAGGAGGDRATEPTPTADPLAALRDLDLLDLERGLRFTRQSDALYLDLMRGFLDEERDLPARLGSARAAGDHTLAERLAHTIRGLASGLGTVELAATAEALERAYRSGADAAAIDAATAALFAAHERLYSAVDGAVPARLPKA